MQHTISFFLLLLTINLSGQIRGIVTDKSTGFPIPYANVFLKDKPVGATTDINGTFEIKSNIMDNVLIISAIGYDSQQFKPNTDNIMIQLVPRTYELSEITVKPRKNKSLLIVETYNKKNIHDYFACSGYPWIVSKYIGFKPEFNLTPSIKQIKILTSATPRDSVIFNFRLLVVNEDGSPGIDILGKNLIIHAQNGRNKLTTIDLSSHHISFPKTGLIIAVEWLIIKQNKAGSKYELQYLPQFGSVTKEGNNKTWIYVGGKWIKTSLIPPNEKNKYKELAAELTLTN
jgi:CarboxypepD_reg-like domain